jgi:uncharacterized protein
MSRPGHIPIRKCIGCGNRRKKDEMTRFVRTANGQISIDSKYPEGRGFYLCPDPACLKIAQKKARRTGFLESVDLDALRARIPSEKEA